MADLRREKEELKRLRAQIDRDILALLAKRARLSRTWAESHPSEAATLPSSARETLDELAGGPAGDLPPEAVRGIFREVHAACRALETPVRVVFVGPEGGYGWVAARTQFGAVAQLLGADGAASALSEVHAKRADFAVLPYESAAEGPVHGTLFALKQSDLKIIAVNQIETALHLLSRTGNPEDVEKIYATAQDRASGQAAVTAAMPKAVLLDVKSPLVACQMAAEDHGAAALAPEHVGREFDLSPIGKAATDDGPLRFAVISARPASRTSKDATGILFTLGDEPGSLFEVLKHFAERGVNLRKIHSHPAEGDGWDYLFFLEVSGHVTDRPIVMALEGVKKQTKTVRVLGSYPV
jgi:chorismate mutase / prephenate dehydratase